jgi:drug/metabolite transporter (DMT)-like permease
MKSHTNSNTKKGIALAVLAAALYATNAPLSKLLLNDMPPTMMAGFLYLGAGVAMVLVTGVRKVSGKSHQEARLTVHELPYTIAMILLDIAAPICLMFGLRSTSATNASLLNNFEIVATALIALMVFKETISLRLWFGILFVTASCVLLSFEDVSSLQFSSGSLLILAACICWGLENNCTRKISSKDPMEIVLLKGIFSGMGSILIGFCTGEQLVALWAILCTMIVGMFAYGMSIFVYVYAQRLLGAARTSAYYAIAPFIGTFFSLIFLRETPGSTYYLALFLMVIGAWLSSNDKPLFRKKGLRQDS